MDIKLPAYIKLVFILLGVVLIVTIMRTAKALLVPIMISGLLAILISPFTSWQEKKGVPSVIAVMISLIALVALLSAFVYFFYNQMIGFTRDLDAIESKIAELISRFNSFIERYIEGTVPISVDNIRETVFKQLYSNIDSLTQGVIATAGTVTMAFIMPVYIFLFLYFRRFLARFIQMAFADQYSEKVKRILNSVKTVVQNYIKGMFLVICILAVLNSIALYSLGVKHAMFFAVFAALLNVIPFIGPFIGATLPIAYTILTADSLWIPFGVFLAFYVIQLAESNYFTPKIVGGKVSMNPLMTIIALFVGNFIWGLAGMILFIPGMAVLKVIFDEIEGMEPYGFLLGKIDDKDPGSNTVKENKLLTGIRKRIKIKSPKSD